MHQEVVVRDGDDELLGKSEPYPIAVAPLVYQESLLGALLVTSAIRPGFGMKTKSCCSAP